MTEYKDKNKTKWEYNELLELLKYVCPSVNLAVLFYNFLCEFMREMQGKVFESCSKCKERCLMANI